MNWDADLRSARVIERLFAMMGLIGATAFIMYLFASALGLWVANELEKRDYARPVISLLTERQNEFLRAWEILPERFALGPAVRVASAIVGVNYATVDEDVVAIQEMMSGYYRERTDRAMEFYQSRVNSRLQVSNFQRDEALTQVYVDPGDRFVRVRFEGLLARYNGALRVSGTASNPYEKTIAIIIFERVTPSPEFPYGLQLVGFRQPGIMSLMDLAHPEVQAFNNTFEE